MVAACRSPLATGASARYQADLPCSALLCVRNEVFHSDSDTKMQLAEVFGLLLLVTGKKCHLLDS